MLHLRFHLTIVLSFAASCLSQYQWPSPQYDALEGLLYEGRRPDGSSLASIVSPCRYRPDTNASIGAEWLRFSFHDTITHETSTGSGGLDGSIAYELNRPENFGAGFTNTLSDFQTYPNKYVSRADIIALGAVFAVATCGGPIIPYRGGRSDAWVAGPSGVPEPQEDIQTHTSQFQNAGFSPSEMIQLVACGHTLGGVRSTDFPDLVSPGPNPTVPQFDNFDTSPVTFDPLVVTQYLDGTTQNPLVVSSNKTMTSDSRVFSSDSNVTMHSIATSTAFASTCQNILEKMLNVVPSNVTLTSPIALLPVKVHAVQLTFERNQLVFKSSLRLTQPIGVSVNTKRTVTMLWCDRYGSAQNCKGTTRSALPASTVVEDPNLSPVTPSQNVSFINYNFVVPINSTVSIFKFWFQVDEKNGSAPAVYNNGGSDYVVAQDQLLFVPMLSNQVLNEAPTVQRRGGAPPANMNYFKVYTIVAAVRDGSNPSRVYMNAVDVAIQNFTAPFNTTVDLQRNDTFAAPMQGYSFYTGIVQDAGFQLTLDLYSVATNGTVYTEDFKQTTFLDNTPYVAPTTVNTSTSTSASQSSSWRLLDDLWKAWISMSSVAVASLLLRTLI